MLKSPVSAVVWWVAGAVRKGSRWMRDWGLGFSSIFALHSSQFTHHFEQEGVGHGNHSPPSTLVALPPPAPLRDTPSTRRRRSPRPAPSTPTSVSLPICSVIRD
ncbi:hypothetical protein I3843_08G138700 [Carya illinoinensis]|nr:hypothetical protein I3843_08G138700 [Carya illinoinensis]